MTDDKSLNYSNRLRVAINATSLLSPMTGIASYVRNLAHALGKLPATDLLFFYALTWSRKLRNDSVPAIDSLKATAKKLIPNPYEAARFIKQWRFNAGIRRYSPDVYHEPNYISFRFDGPVVVTVHDLSHMRYAHAHPAERVRIMDKLLPHSIEGASEIIVDSQFVKREVIDEFAVPAEKVHAIPLGVTTSYAPRPIDEIAPVLSRCGLTSGRYIFAVGTLEPRKNLIQAINAHEGLPAAVRRRIPLVIAGMKGWLTQELDARIRAAEERGEVRWLGYVPAGDLPLLYAGARLFVYPSLYEGFGLPVLEAMASGVPVITSNRASLPEVAGDAAVMVDPHDLDGLREAMLRLIEDEQEAQRRAELGRVQAARFTWQACAEKTLAVYRRALEVAGRNA